jgi:hypothetical protein
MTTEVHLADRQRGFGGFLEQLLTLRTSAEPQSSGSLPTGSGLVR